MGFDGNASRLNEVPGRRSDLGSRRSYDSSGRKERAKTRRLRRALDRDSGGDGEQYNEQQRSKRAVERIARQLDRNRVNRGRDRVVKQRRRRHHDRLAEIPLDRRCQLCGHVKLRSKQWVVSKNRLYSAICLSCYRSLHRKGRENKGEMESKVVQTSIEGSP